MYYKFLPVAADNTQPHATNVAKVFKLSDGSLVATYFRNIRLAVVNHRECDILPGLLLERFSELTPDITAKRIYIIKVLLFSTEIH